MSKKGRVDGGDKGGRKVEKIERARGGFGE